MHTVGKGRKERRTPLLPATVAVLRAWMAERRGAPGDPLFPTSTGRLLSRDAIERRITLHSGKAARAYPSLRSKHVTIHTLRYSCAMNLLQSGNDIAVIALWLGHEQVSTTSIYLHADMSQKNARSPAPSRPPPPQAATAPPTTCSPSSKLSDYADSFRPLTPGEQALRTGIGIIRGSA